MPTPGLNVLLLFPDQWRPDWIGSNAALPLRLPHLKRLESEGTRFSRAITSSPVCAPSRACFALGVEYDACPVKHNGMNLPLDRETFYARLRASGYHVLGCGKIDLAKAAHDWSPDGSHPQRNGRRRVDAWGFTAAVSNSGKLDGVREARRGILCPHTHFLQDHELLKTHLDDYARREDLSAYRHTAPTPLPDFAYADNFEGEQGLALLRNVPTGQPWFLQVNFSGPHDPVDVTRPMAEPWQNTAFPAPVDPDPRLSATEHTATRRCYAAMLENIDRWIGLFRDEVQKRGEADRTLVVFASDHGEMLGDHRRWRKSIPYQASMGIPLVVAGPGVHAGAENRAPVTLLDVAATVLDVAGVGGGGKFNDGRSLLPVLKDPAAAPPREVALSGLESWRAAFDGRWKYIRNFEGQTLLFDLETDPHELNNVLAANPEVVTRLSPFLKNAPTGPGAAGPRESS